MKNMEENLNLEQQYLFYLNKVNLKLDQMHPQQKIQVKQAFYGACGQMLILLRDTVGELNEEEAMKAFENLLNQVADYWTNPKNHK